MEVTATSPESPHKRARSQSMSQPGTSSMSGSPERLAPGDVVELMGMERGRTYPSGRTWYGDAHLNGRRGVIARYSHNVSCGAADCHGDWYFVELQCLDSWSKSRELNVRNLRRIASVGD